MTDQMQPFEVANALRSHDAQWYQRLGARLHWFSFVVPRPKEAEGDQLAVAFRLDGAQSEELYALLALPPIGSGACTPDGGPLRTATVSCHRSRIELDSSAVLQPWPTLTVRLWNPRDAWSVDDELVDTAEDIERRLDLLPLRRWPLETRLLGWLTPDRHPELFRA